MTTIRFNPLDFANKLKKAGETTEVAEILANQQAELISQFDNNFLATKSDIQDLKSAIETLSAKLSREIIALENRMLAKLGGLMIGAITILTYLKS